MIIRLLFSSSITLRRVVITTIITMTLLLAAYYLHPINNNWFYSENFSVSNFLQFVFIDQIALELATTFIIFIAVVRYAQLLKMEELVFNTKNVFIFYLKFIPLIFVLYFVFSPITINLRYLYHHLILQKENLDYFNSYFLLNSKLYAAYLPVVFLSGIQFLTIILLDSFKKNQNIKKKAFYKNIILKVKTGTGEKLVNSQDVVAICKEQNHYKVFTTSDSFVIIKNLSQLEEELDTNFVRINRSTIVNLKYFKEYSFWKNEKYIFRMSNAQEFNITRTRLKAVKKKIKEYHDASSHESLY